MEVFYLGLIVYDLVKIHTILSYYFYNGNNKTGCARCFIESATPGQAMPCLPDHQNRSIQMSDLVSFFKALRRPRLLIRAARIGATEYRRDRDLRRLLRASRLPGPAAGMRRLLALEADFEAVRRAKDTTYSISRHVEILSALIAEAQLLIRSNPAQP